MGAVCSSSRTLGGIVKCRIYRRTSQRTCQIFMFAPELEKTLTASHPEVPTPGGADVRSDRCLFALPTPAALVMCEQRRTFCQTRRLGHSGAGWSAVQSETFFFPPRSPSVPKNRSESVPPSGAGAGRGERGRC